MRARATLQALARRPGFRRGRAGRATDAPGRWVLVTEWGDVGSFRRAIGHLEVREHATALLAGAVEEPMAFEELIDVAPGEVPVLRASDRA